MRRLGGVPLMLGAFGSDVEPEEPDDLIDGSENWSSDVDDLDEP
ncbi:hypothetical protein ACNOYE_21310 [Nannocystaceae bacterium ST9]